MDLTYSVFRTPVVPSYAAELSDSDSDDDGSDSDDDGSDSDVAPPSPVVNPHAQTTKRSREDASVSTPPTKYPRIDASPSVEDAADHMPSDDSKRNESENVDGNNCQPPISKTDQILWLATQWAFKLKTRMRNPLEHQSAQEMVDKARCAIQYEIDTGKPWKLGIGRASSYFQMMKGLLNVSNVRMKRKMILEVIDYTMELLEK